ncbi:MAG: hypothetical protein PF961_01150 [Planctomycetota bacterium]|jgi:xylan 1,4-beta-xylosidase|nr:hypothetical protein [Planctomycetota bacterium]
MGGLRVAREPAAAPLRMPWREAVAVGRGFELLRADVREHLARCQREIGFKACRFHAIFHDEVGVVTRGSEGELVYRWHHLDQIYDALLELGLKPFVELNPMPACLASGDQTMFHYRMNVTPPADFGEWGEFIEAFARHCVTRWGLDEVRSWNFEVWNEPNLSGFWSGTKEEYFQLYASAARALKRVDAQLQVGGPASSKCAWLDDLIAWCESEDVPLDFLSTHLYSQDEFVEFDDRAGSPHEPNAFFIDRLRAAKAEVGDRPLHITEWNSLSCGSSKTVDWTGNPSVDNAYAGAFAARMALELDQDVDTLCWWVASDRFEEGGVPQAPFGSIYGLLTVDGIPKSSYNALQLCARLRGARQSVSGDAAPNGCGLVATRECETVHVVAYHQPFMAAGPAQPWQTTVRIPVDHAEQVVTAIRVRAGAGSAYETWLALGRPQDPSPAQMAVLRAHAVPEHTMTRHQAEQGELALSVTVAPNEVLYLECREPSPAVHKLANPELERWNADMGEQSR